MAKRIEGPYDFSRYNFATYADGATWELEEGADFEVTPGTIISNARRWAASEGLDVDVKLLEASPKDPTRVALRFRKMPSNVHKIAQ